MSENPMNSFSAVEGYPQEFDYMGRRFRFVGESKWMRKFRATDGHMFAVPRWMDGSFDESVFTSVDPHDLGERERQEAGFVLMNYKRSDGGAPENWKFLIDEFKEQSKRWEREYEEWEKEGKG